MSCELTIVPSFDGVQGGVACHDDVAPTLFGRTTNNSQGRSSELARPDARANGFLATDPALESMWHVA